MGYTIKATYLLGSIRTAYHFYIMTYIKKKCKYMYSGMECKFGLLCKGMSLWYSENIVCIAYIKHYVFVPFLENKNKKSQTYDIRIQQPFCAEFRCFFLCVR